MCNKLLSDLQVWWIQKDTHFKDHKVFIWSKENRSRKREIAVYLIDNFIFLSYSLSYFLLFFCFWFLKFAINSIQLVKNSLKISYQKRAELLFINVKIKGKL